MTASVPPPASGSNVKYILLALFFLGSAAGLYFFLKPPAETTEEPTTPARVAVRDDRPPAFENTFVVPEVVPDMGPAKAPRRRVVYVDGQGGGAWDECSGEITRSAITSVFSQGRGGVTACYERRLKSNNQLEGNVMVKLKISENGNVVAQQVNGSLQDNEVFACIRSVTSQWHFPPPSGGCAVVQAPFNFSRQR